MIIISYICIRTNVIMNSNPNFVRELEQGKATVRLDKVAQVFNLFGYELIPQKKVR